MALIRRIGVERPDTGGVSGQAGPVRLVTSISVVAESQRLYS
jgi:hypothetical protein